MVGISSLGYDHVQLLGKSIEEIAWQKAGIMKNNCIAITACDQPPEALKILQERALERKVNFFYFIDFLLIVIFVSIKILLPLSVAYLLLPNWKNINLENA